MAPLTPQSFGCAASSLRRRILRLLSHGVAPLVLWCAAFASPALAITADEVAALRLDLETVPTDASNVDARLAAARDLLDTLGAAGHDMSIYAIVFDARGRVETAAGDLEAVYRTLHRYCFALVRHFETGEWDVGTPSDAGATHPHLFFTAGAAGGGGGAVNAEQAAILEVNRLSVAQFADGQPLAYATLVAAGGIDPWRTYGNNLVELAFRAMITDDPADIAAARRWLLAVCAYPHWGAGNIPDRDLPAAHLLFGVGLTYDWLHDVLSPEDRAVVRRKLANQAAMMHSFAAGYAAIWWRDTWTQNHTTINNAGLGMAGYALRGEVVEADEWAAQARANAESVLTALSRIGDGSYHEGVAYWSYMLSYLLAHTSAIEQADGMDLVGANPWLRETLYFRLYAQQPDAFTVTSFADGALADYDGPQHILRALDARYRTGYGEWLARQITVGRGPMYYERRRWAPFEFFWYDPTVEPKAPTDLPTSRLFPDLDFLVMRTGWSADAAVLTLKSSTPEGRSRYEDVLTQRPGAGHLHATHDHPNQNAVTLFAHGAQLLGGPGYPLPKLTHKHNTILVDTTGQVGEGSDAFDLQAAVAADARGQILRHLGVPLYDFAVAEAGPTYPATLGVQRYTRRVLFLKPSFVLLVDQVDLDSRLPVHLVWRRYGERFSGRGGTVETEAAGGASLRLGLLAPRSLKVKYGSDTAAPGAPPFYFARLNARRARRTNRFVTLATVRASSTEGVPVSDINVDGPDGMHVTMTDAAGTYAVGLAEGAPAATSFGLTGRVGVVHTNPTGEVQDYFLGDGTELRDWATGQVIVRSQDASVTVQVRLQDTTAHVDAASDALVSLYAPAAATVLVNGAPTAFTRDGDRVVVHVTPGGTATVGP